jgi:diguanylate cyclase (GGDEF)-like protein
MGGDEFVLLLLGSDQAAIGQRIDQLRQMIWHAASGDEFYDQVSMSVGAAAFPQDGSDADELLAEADRRMYKAKQDYKTRMSPAAALSPRALEIATIQ